MPRIEQALAGAVASCEAPGCPPRLAAAIRYAVFPGGARVRPRLCLAVAAACGEPDSPLADAAAAAIELLHCASLAHDDLPCFDDAATRRSRPSLHRAFDERLAVLAGDALIVLAFQHLGRCAGSVPERLGAVLAEIGRAAGAPHGIIAGQGWECEATVPLADYQRAKTGALFVAAAGAGALAAGVDGTAWRSVGERLGEAYQVADDIRDVLATTEEMGKPNGRDAALGRPSIVAELGAAGAIRHFDRLVGAVLDSIPACPGAAALRSLMLLEARRLLPDKLTRRAA
ncbi:MAG: polyprenyl synthetase family protein [Steroidobacteraceae bacterium]|jgi:geranylgeranyl diphosphate synthase type II|nr:polyprenyl synthetase family protein [Steroidobacteraceae bacterium]